MNVSLYPTDKLRLMQDFLGGGGDLLEVRRVEGIPPQSWLLSVGDRVSLHCGNNVEVWADAFFEGAWAGRFDDIGFSKNANVFGSGAIFADGCWKLVPPSHTLEAIYALRLEQGDWLVSNSLAFIHSRAPFHFISPFRRREIESFIGIVRGIQKSPSRLQVSAGLLYILRHHNAYLGADDIERQRKPLPPNFNSYENYYSYLRETLEQVAQNARHTGRMRKYQLCTSVSSGYDSVACAAIASHCGCKDAITFIRATNGESDSGADVSAALGLNVKSYIPPQTISIDPNRSAEFFAAGMNGDDAVYEPVRGELSGAILVTGFHGDKVWDKSAKPNDKIKRGDVSGSSLGEFRLREGFVHLPLPFVGATRHKQIVEISNSAALSSYSVGGPYDRPIPRRIGEEAGVPRHLFGQKKKAVHLQPFSQMGRRAFPDHLQAEIIKGLRGKSIWKRYRYHARCVQHDLPWFAQRLLWKMLSPLVPINGGAQQIISKSLERFPQWISYLFSGAQNFQVFAHSHPFNTLTFEWSLRKVAKRYERRVDSGGRLIGRTKS
jgi:hypothetical protein